MKRYLMPYKEIKPQQWYRLEWKTEILYNRIFCAYNYIYDDLIPMPHPKSGKSYFNAHSGINKPFATLQEAQDDADKYLDEGAPGLYYFIRDVEKFEKTLMVLI